MTSRPVMDAAQSISSYASKNGIAPKSNSKTGSFSEALEGVSKTESCKADDKSGEDLAKTENVKTDKFEDVKSEKTETKETKPQKADTDKSDAGKVEKPDEMSGEEISEHLEEAAEKVIEAIAGALGIPVAAVKDMMAKLQLDKTAVLQTDKLTGLVAALSGGVDETSILTDEGIYNAVQDVLDSLQTIQNQLQEITGLSDEELQAMLSKAMAEQGEQTKGGGTESFTQILSAAENTDQSDATVVRNAESLNGSEYAAKTTQTQTQETTSAETAKEQERQSITETMQTQDQEHQAGQNRDFESGGQYLQQSQQTISQTAAEMQMAKEAFFQMPDTQEIMDQITEYMKMSIKPELSQLEMQLHPESLGTLHIQISSREGVMTAQFTTQSEDVKAVLESQMLTLRQNLENQGVKVEAVEVTVSEYSLDRSFSQEDHSKQQETPDKKSKGRSIRLNLNELDFDEEELSIEEKLTADIMKTNGSTVNYTA